MCIERHNWRSYYFREERPTQQSMMVNKSGKLIISLLFVGALYTADAAISWSTPNIAAANCNETLSVAENQATDTTIKTYAATGASTVTYTLTPAVSPFSLTAGALKITADLDHETTPSYTLHIVATDGTDTGTATIFVTVTDVNEYDPVFSATYSPCIADKSPADTTLTTVTATDKDTSQKITYAISSGDTAKDFKIDAKSGLIQVNDGKTLDKAAKPSFALVVTAVDNVATVKTGSTTVSVTVADSCDSGTATAVVSIMMLMVSLFVTFL